MIASTAIQKSTRWTRHNRRISPMSIMPNTTASMMIAARTGLGRSENSGASTNSVRIDDDPGDDRCHRRAGPGRVVQRARRQARRHRHALEQPGADVAHALGDHLLVDADAVAVPSGEQARVAGGLREPDQEQRDRSEGDRAGVGRGRCPTAAAPGGHAARHRADGGDPVIRQIEQPRGQQPADDEHEGARNPRRAARAGRSRCPARRSRRARVVQWMSSSVRSQLPSSRQLFVPSRSCRSAWGARRSRRRSPRRRGTR